MCTVTYLPVSTSEYILTSNRDEQVDRKPAIQPQAYTVCDSRVVFPKDQQANGTWIAASDGSFTLCLLNGAFKTHTRQLTYRKSRGLVLLDFFKFNAIDSFLSQYDFMNIEPFTLVFVESTVSIRLVEATWDGIVMHRREMDTKVPHIWSSVTLYSPNIIAERKKWFFEFLKENQQNPADAILDFHYFGGGSDNSNRLLMNRDNKVKTVSITSVQRQQNQTCMIYNDVINEKTYSKRVS